MLAEKIRLGIIEVQRIELGHQIRTHVSLLLRRRKLYRKDPGENAFCQSLDLSMILDNPNVSRQIFSHRWAAGASKD
jgi:hypothetical protein